MYKKILLLPFKILLGMFKMYGNLMWFNATYDYKYIEKLKK